MMDYSPAPLWNVIAQLYRYATLYPEAYAQPATETASVTNTSQPNSKDLITKTAFVDKSNHSTIVVKHSGVWTIWAHVPLWSDNLPGTSWLNDVSACLPHMHTILEDLRQLGWNLCMVYFLSVAFRSFMPTVRLAQTSRVLLVIEEAVKTGKVDRTALYWTIVVQLSLCLLDWAINQCMNWCRPLLEQRFRYHFKQRLFKLKLRLDIATSEMPEVKAKLQLARTTYGPGSAWDSFKNLISLAGLVLEVASQSTYVIQTMLHQPGGTTIVTLCLLDPLLRVIEYRRWNEAFWAKITNTSWKRMHSMLAFAASSEAKAEVIGNGWEEYIASEYQEARDAVGDSSERYPCPWGGLERPFSFYSCLQQLTNESALVVLALKIAFDPASIPLTSIAMLEQTTRSMNSSLHRVCDGSNSVLLAFQTIKSLYEVDLIQNLMRDGDLAYPPADSENQQGMKVEFRNVSFKYPNAEAMAIDGLSFIVPTGHLCVIVGENGCGKSSTIKLLNRLYDATGGEILIDNRPIQNYRVRDIRAACAVMHQEYQHFNLSLRENIGLGNPDLETIKQAARLGGAHGFIEKLPGGYDTDLSDNDRTYSNGSIPKGSALDAFVKRQKVPQKEFSGGETQRLALSRTFMRSTTSSVRILAYDEPSAALDPKAEFALFERLRKQREGKTMIFVTHRLGYLTKYADVIVYMEQGRAVEQGSHDELMALGGKYASLYNVQAQAFS